MKKQIQICLVITIVSALLTLGCNSANDKKKGITTTMNKDSAIVVQPMRTTTDSSANDSTAKSNPALKGKHGKVSSVLVTKADKNSSMDMDKEGYYKNVEILPAFPGGQKALDKFIADHIEYPSAAIGNGIEGTVVVNFAVDENGLIYTPQVESPRLGYGLEIAAMKVVNSMPQWTPGRIRGKNVKTHYSLPIHFQLSE